MTYYSFLSLFPLLLVFTSITDIVSQGNQSFQQTVMNAVNSYFPVIGEQLARNIAVSTKSGAALIVGLVFTFYGARGGADAFRGALQHMWHIPKKLRPGFPKTILVSAATIIFGGIGLVSAAVLSASASGLGRSFVYKILATAGALAILIPTFYILYRLNLPRNIGKKNIAQMAAYCSVSVLVAQGIGSYLITRQLKTLSPLYGTFALVLGILFWLYLQSTVVLYIIQIRIVRSRNLWPRSISGKLPTAVDRQLHTD